MEINHFLDIPIMKEPIATQSHTLLVVNCELTTSDALKHITNSYPIKHTDVIFCEQFNAVCLLIHFHDTHACDTAYNELSKLFDSVFYVQPLCKFQKRWICTNCGISNPCHMDHKVDVFECNQCTMNHNPNQLKYSYVPMIHHSHSKHQLVPLIFIHDHSTNTLRPLQFGEPLLDALGAYSEHELIVDIKEISPSKSELRTHVIISKNKDNFVCNEQNKSISLLNHLIDKVDMNVCSDNTIKVIFGHSKFSPVRRLKQYILSQENVDNTTNKSQKHAQFLKHLPTYCGNSMYPKLAAAIILMDCDDNILLTRRHSKLRSFPSCFVVPGGSVDPGELLQDAAKRELLEEVGIDIVGDNMEMIAIWESIYPDVSRMEAVTEHTIKYHHILPIYTYRLSKPYSEYKLKLCPVEVDAAVWVNANVLQSAICCGKYSNQIFNGLTPNGDAIQIKMECLNGIYPNRIGQGIARGHRYGIKKLLEKLSRLCLP